MLFNIIYEFFVLHVFGGFIEGDSYAPSAIGVFYPEDLYFDNVTLGQIKALELYDMGYGGVCYMSLGNYLSFIATIITMILLLVICCKIIKGIYNSVAHVIN